MSLQLSLSRLSLGPSALVSAKVSAAITPAMSALHDGQSIDDVPNYATMISPSNFTVVDGSVSSVAVTFQGDAVNAATVLAEDETAGFTVTVTDDQAVEYLFTASPITVEYKSRITVTAGNEAEVDINPIVADAENITITIDSTDYVRTAGDLRAGPINLVLPTISGTTGAGDTLTADNGAWTTSTATITLTNQWQRDGADISGETGSTYTVLAGDAGTDITVDVEGDDGTNTPVTASSAATSIPGSLSVTELGSVARVSNEDDSDTITGIDVGAIADGTILIAVIAACDVNSGATFSAPTLGANTFTEVVTAPPSGERGLGAIYRWTKSGTGTQTFTWNYSEYVSAVSIKLYECVGATTVIDSAEENTSATTFDVSVNTTASCILIGGSANYLTSATHVGITMTEQVVSSRYFYHGAQIVSTAETPRTVTATHRDPAHAVTVAVTVE